MIIIINFNIFYKMINIEKQVSSSSPLASQPLFNLNHPYSQPPKQYHSPSFTGSSTTPSAYFNENMLYSPEQQKRLVG